MSRRSRLEAFVDALLRDRRPRRFGADAEEAQAMRAAAALRAGRPGADLPQADFVDGLAGRMRRELEREGDAPGVRLSRRALLRGGAAAAAAVAGGVALDRALPHGGSPATAGNQTWGETLVPDNGTWVDVAAVDAVPAGHAVRFSAGGVEGFVVNHGDTLDALSAVCTHMGCIVRFESTTGRLRCPCHGAAFALDGSPVGQGYIAALPRLRWRVQAGQVQVLVGQEA